MTVFQVFFVSAKVLSVVVQALIGCYSMSIYQCVIW